MPLSNLSATADPFIPMTNPLSVNYYFDQYKYLKMLESAAMSDPTLLSKIKSEFYQLRDELDSFLNTAGKPNSPAPKSTISCSPPLTPRQLKRQLRAANFRARLNSDSVDPPIPRKPSNLTRKLPPHSKHKCFFQYLDMVDAGIIKIPDSPRYLPSVVPISPPSTSISAAKPSVVIGISSSLPIKSFLPRRPPKSPPPTPLLQSRSIVLPTIHQPTWPSNWPTNYSDVFKIFSMQYFSPQGYIFEKYLSLSDIRNKVNSCDDSISISDFFHYSLVSCSITFCNKYLQCCKLCGLTSKECGDSPICWKYCSDCSVPHRFFSCPKLHLWLHDPKSPYYSDWMDIVRNHLNTTYVPTFKSTRK